MSRDPVTDEGRFVGGLCVTEQAVYQFPQGLPGFEELTRFLLCEREALQPLTLLIAIDAANVVLPLLRPGEFLSDYWPLIPEHELQALEVESREELEMFIVVSFEEGGKGVTANLRAPICFNVARRLGRQVVLPDATYPLQYALVRAHE